ncbi:hypothetical protein [Streptomyces sp. H27-S2]|uniref:hypothetical protein n=1 Tax=Streptomyces antarcticus TaxID=2996458 RepID=UPI002271F133|nr:hypothetical protein [Streptomyces sp. H27-S2]MCY0951414.1 hypothetical protein [Streptomyces sp. H27-S2]
MHRTDIEVGTLDELPDSVLDAQQARVGTWQNDDMRRIPAWAALFAIPGCRSSTCARREPLVLAVVPPRAGHGGGAAELKSRPAAFPGRTPVPGRPR